MRTRRRIAWLLGFSALLVGSGARAADVSATPADYKSLLPTLQPGDTLHLAAGDYPLLPITNLNGTSTAWITITGPGTGPPATIDADPGPCCNTVEITDSSYVAIENLTIDGKNVDGAFGISAGGGTGNLVHDIRVEGCNLVNHHGSQQHDAISTKTPTWGWIIRQNRITDAGTGLYLGNSDGSDPFVGGLIEDNLVENPIGYCMEIKWQQPRPTVTGMPTSPTTTIVRNNVFIKNDDPSPDGDRPNVLVGGFPASGAGSQDRYEFYGNFFFHNPRESLFQASGRVTVHDNVFVDAPQTRAMLFQDHDLPLELATVYDNTVYGTLAGIVFGNSAPQGDAVVGNLIFAAAPISGPIANQSDNLVDTLANAATYVNAPSTTLGQMDFYPRPGQCQGSPIDESSFVGDTDYAVDFNGTSKGTFTFRGAYAGQGQNPGWTLTDDLKGTTTTTSPDAGADAEADAALPGDDAGSPGSGGSSGCSCDTTPAPGALSWPLLLLSLVAFWRARRAPR